MSWKNVKLGSIVAELESGSRPKGGSLSTGVASIGGTQISENGGFKWDTIHYVPESYFSSLKSGIIQQNDLLVVKDGATTGKVAIVDEAFPYDKASINEHVFRLKIDENKALPKYVFFYLYTETGQREILKDFRGATVGGISRNFVEKITIPLPDLITQQKIVAVLDKAQNLIHKREKSIQLLDDLLKSTFLEMFGDPVKSDLFPLKKLGTGIKLLGGYAFKSKDFKETGIPLIKIGTVNKGYFDTSTFSYLPENFEPTYKKYIVYPGEILITLTGTIGKDDFANVCLADSSSNSYLLNQRVAKIEVSEDKFDNNFLFYLLKHPSTKKNLQKLSKGVRQANISNSNVESIQVIYPNLDLQKTFGDIASHINLINQNNKKAKTEIEKLFQSLLQNAFAEKLRFNEDLPLDVILDQFLMGDTTKLEKKQNRELLNTLSKSSAKLDEFKNRIGQQQFDSLDEYEKGKAILFELLQFSTPAIEQDYDRITKKVNLK